MGKRDSVLDFLRGHETLRLMMPANVIQATWMQGVGLLWLREHAPERLTASGEATAEESSDAIRGERSGEATFG